MTKVVNKNIIASYDDLKRNTSEILALLEERKDLIDRIILDKEKALMHTPDGKLHVASRGKYKSYYVRKDPSDKTGTYISKSNLAYAKVLAQKEYDTKLVCEIKKLRNKTSVFQKDIIKFQESIENFCPNAKDLIAPIVADDETYILAWNSVRYQGKSFEGCNSEYYTSKDERVRSKSEVIIADTLARRGISYRYEYPIKMGNITVYPDFYCLNLHKRHGIIYEHFGMMDNSEYVEYVLRKIKTYETNGYKLGEDFVFSMETSIAPINTKQIELIIDNYLI